MFRETNDHTPILEPFIMLYNKNKLSLEIAVQLVPRFDGKIPQDGMPIFIGACDFVMNSDNATRSILLNAIQITMIGKAFVVKQFREIT